MTSEINTLNKAGYELTADEFDNMQSKHPYIGEKLILDLVNGVGVVAKDLNDSSKSKEKGFSRIWDGLSGSSKKRQNLINENFIEGLNATSQWLQDHDRHFSRIDIRMKNVADELYNTQDEILKFYGQFKEVDFRVEMLESFKKNAEQRFDKIEDRLTREEAYTHISKEVAKLGNLGLSLEFEIFTIIDNLSSGKAGLYHTLETDIKEKNEFLNHIKHEIKNRLLTMQLKEHLNYKTLYSEIKKLEPIEQKAIAFIGSQYSSYSKNNSLYEISDIIKIISTSMSYSEMENKIKNSSHISTFMTLDNYIDEATTELLTL